MISIDPLGFVRSDFDEDRGERNEGYALLELNPKYTEALDGIEEYSHIIVIFWMHKLDNQLRTILKTHPRGREDIPLVGVLATRGKARPNPIGVSVVQLVEKSGNILKVKGLDAYDGSPILDIKPYDFYDVKADIRVPEWWLKISSRKG
ncbi:MAG: tRNA (N6-threonylcarbamoyladenosine(37)-N6)-methyltransferase TrmO [Nitrososphaerales archaeon]